MYLTEKHIVKYSKELDDLCFKTKNLYNKSNYIVRNEFINTGRYISKNEMYVQFKTLPEFKDIKNARIARGVLRTLDANWQSFFSCIKKWKNHKEIFNGRPNLPKYLDKNGRFTALFYDTSIKRQNKNGEIGFSQTDIRIKRINEGRIIEAQLIPLKNKEFKLNIVYEYQESNLNKNNEKYCSIDLGVNNLMTLTSNVGLQPLIINGRSLKSINQYYNKQRSKFQSELPKNIFSSLKINKLNYKRELKIDDYLHKTSKFIIEYCIKNEFNTIVIGYNELWKQNLNIGKKNNQKFVQIPFQKLSWFLEYRCKKYGINFKKQEESYTSKCSSIDLETIIKHNVYLGSRIKRGLFKTSKELVINADVNGSLNILRKAVPNVIFTNGIEDCAVNPKRIKSFKHN